MDLFVTGGVMHGGTYNSHPIGMAATVATLNELKKGEVYRRIARSGRRLMDGLTGLLAERQIAARCQGSPASSTCRSARPSRSRPTATC
jgi:glutamate-1-semialdehyde 2,1-aminomutase